MTTELDYMVRSQITRYGFNGSIEILSEYLVLQKVPSEANPKVRNNGEGPY